MKTVFLFLFTVTFPFFGFSQNQILGKWKTENQKATVEIYESKGVYYGKIVWLQTPVDSKSKPVKDTKNPDPKKRSRNVMGINVLYGFKYKNNEWIGGKVYNPETGETYECKIWLKDANTLKGRGYWGILYNTQEWKRVG
jgi:uncharacterized protein (DUF2147 family)